MSVLKINVWKKDTDRQTSMPDYQIEIDDTGYIASALVLALNNIATAIEAKEEKVKEEKEKR